MNVRELIAELQKLDPEMPVAVSGYEGGAEILSQVHVIDLVEGAEDTEDWWGTHLFLGDGYMLKHEICSIKPALGAVPFKAVFLPRKRFKV